MKSSERVAEKFTSNAAPKDADPPRPQGLPEFPDGHGKFENCQHLSY